MFRTKQNLLSFLPDSELGGQKPSQLWSRQHDQDLLFGCFKYGIGNYELFFRDQEFVFYHEKRDEHQFKRITDRIKYLVNNIKKATDNLKNLDFKHIHREAPRS